MAPSRYDLSYYRDVKHKEQSNKQKETKNTQFQHDVLRDNMYGNGFWVNFIESEAQKRVPGIRKKETRHCRIRRRQIEQIKTKN